MEARIKLMAHMICQRFCSDREFVRDLIASLSSLPADPALEAINLLAYRLYRDMPPVAPSMSLILQANHNAALPH